MMGPEIGLLIVLFWAWWVLWWPAKAGGALFVRDGRGRAGVSPFLYVEEWPEGTAPARLSEGIYRLEGTDGSPSVADNYGRTDGQREGAS